MSLLPPLLRLEAIDNLRIMEERNSRRAKQIILDDIQKIEDTLDSLETQRNGLAHQLGLHLMTDEQIDEVKAFAVEISKDLESFRQDFEGRLRLVEMLDVNATLKVEEGEKVIYVQCRLGDENLSFEKLESYGRGHKQQPGIVLTTRLLLK